MDEKLARAELIIGYTFKDKEWALEALQMAWANKSAANQPMILSGKTYYVPYNQRLAGVGDKVLDVVLAEHWSRTGITKGHWVHTVREPLTSNANLCRIGQARGLDQCVRKDCFFAGGKVYGKNVADVVEALIGAAYFDGRLEAAGTVIANLGLLAKPCHLPVDKACKTDAEKSRWDEKVKSLHTELDALFNEFLFEKDWHHLNNQQTEPDSYEASEETLHGLKIACAISLLD